MKWLDNLTIQGILALMTVSGTFGLFFVSAFVKPLDASIINSRVAALRHGARLVFRFVQIFAGQGRNDCCANAA